ncbi:undecaprenyl-diphosphate phosphatase [Bacteroidetes bacterium endosymbiont of Geopemphigus sp.]|uniref:undecaprenyl-diphosphate phosphatase n=1 Tax=Bacteroidetes bacterium endosymbiont of Geopemphigus sp. TaxID=2047937 RepID=UPI000CCFD42D|nr:undecaprenyl-diphosphate phosphatase [Bacteroidetes bacterium endosymbiont of Geopemphigus sp.]
MSYLDSFILALIEGFTEFVPVSSTGHMIIASSIMGIASKEFTKLFNVFIQFGAIFSVLIVYKKRFKSGKGFYSKLLLAFLPAVVLGGLPLSKQIDAMLESILTVAVALVTGGIILIRVDEWFKKTGKSKTPTYINAFIIGLFQCLAMIPGVSRSGGATIVGGITQKLSRKSAAEFSFFLGVPTVFGATGKKLFDYYLKDYFLSLKNSSSSFKFSNMFTILESKITARELQILLSGNIIAFLVGMLAISSFVTYLGKNDFKLFGYYRIILGCTLLFIHYFIHPLNVL